MRAMDLRHATLFVVALALSVAAMATAHLEAPSLASRSEAPAPSTQGAAAMTVVVPEGGFRRVVSVNLVADGVLAEIAEPSRVMATTSWIDPPHPRAHILAGLPRIDTLDEIERILMLRPDLVLVATPHDPARARRLEAEGITVVGLSAGAAREDLDADITTVAALLGAPARGQALRANLDRRRAALRALSPTKKPRALFVSAISGATWGGALGTSYHDILDAAGMRDVATEAGLRGWPQLRAEHLLAWDPDVLAGEEGLRASLCANQTLGQLRACREEGAILELPPRVVNDPGPARIEAAERLAEALRARAGPR